MLAQNVHYHPTQPSASKCLNWYPYLYASAMSQDSSLASSNDSTTTLPLSPDLSPQRILPRSSSPLSASSQSYQQFLQSTLDDVDDPQLEHPTDQQLNAMIEQVEQNEAMLHRLRRSITTVRASVRPPRSATSITGHKRTLTEMEATDTPSSPSATSPASDICLSPPMAMTTLLCDTTSTTTTSTSVNTRLDDEYRSLPTWRTPSRKTEAPDQDDYTA